MNEREALKLALEALDCIYSPLHVREINKVGDAMKAIREALAQPEQEPVATVQCINGVTIGYLEVMQPIGTKLYTTPPQRTWVGLTDEDIWETPTLSEFARAIEAKLKEKNT